MLGIHPSARVIVLSGQTGSEARDAAIEAGATAYLVKGALVDDVVDAILDVAD